MIDVGRVDVLWCGVMRKATSMSCKLSFLLLVGIQFCTISIRVSQASLIPSLLLIRNFSAGKAGRFDIPDVFGRVAEYGCGHESRAQVQGESICFHRCTNVFIRVSRTLPGFGKEKWLSLAGSVGKLIDILCCSFPSFFLK